MCQSRISQPTNLEQSEKHIDNTVGEIIARQKDAYSNKTEEQTSKFVVLIRGRE